MEHIRARAKDLMGHTIRRALPYRSRRMVGPWIFLDHMGPATLEPGRGIDIPPHPHVGLATVTYLFEGSYVHKDSQGFTQRIVPGDVNWMTSGRGIVHSERTPAEERTAGASIHSLQAWVALPAEHEEIEPSFVHHPRATLPGFREGEARLRLVAGTAFGRSAPVETLSPLFYVEAHVPAGAELALPPEMEECGVYVVSGRLSHASQALEAHDLGVFTRERPGALRAELDTVAMFLGGDPLGERHIAWNFVSSRPERIERAKADWRADRFDPVPGETERIPLPD